MSIEVTDEMFEAGWEAAIRSLIKQGEE